MTKMTHTGENHGQIMLVGGGDNFSVAHGAARLDNR